MATGIQVMTAILNGVAAALRGDPCTDEEIHRADIAAMEPLRGFVHYPDQVFVCATSWVDFKRFAGIEPPHTLLAQKHGPSRPDIPAPRAYRLVEGEWHRLW